MAGAPVVSAELRTLDLAGGAREGLWTHDWRPVRAQRAVYRWLHGGSALMTVKKPQPGRFSLLRSLAVLPGGDVELPGGNLEQEAESSSGLPSASRRHPLQHAGSPGPPAERG